MAVNSTDSEAVAEVFTFGTVDYVVFGVMLGVSATIGLYFGYTGRRKNTTDEYLRGGKRMKPFPIAASLVASLLSGVSVMSTPAEIYGFGLNYFFGVCAVLAVIPALCYFVIPVFYDNNIASCYEYLQMRFNKQIRQIVTVAYIVTAILYLPIVIFIPSLAFSQVTGTNIHLINGIVCSVCILYTMLGGIKAVVWTDVFQGGIMVVTVILIAVVGVVRTGGMAKVFDHAVDGGRLTPDLRFDLYTRATLWNCLLGGFFIWCTDIGFSQSCVQRIVSLPSLAQAKKALYMFGIGFFSFKLLNSFIGVVMFAKYHDCDPVAMEVVEKNDNLMPYFVQDLIGTWYGMPGLFISCVFSASLSTMSAGLNTLSGVFYLDYIKSRVKHTEAKANFVMKGLVVIIGIYCVCAGLVVEKFKSIMQMIITIAGVSNGVVFAIFMLGLFVPRINGKVALLSLVAGLVVMLVVVCGAMVNMAIGTLSYEPLPTRTDGCESTNSSLSMPVYDLSRSTSDIEDVFPLFRISYYWYTVMGVILACCFAIPLSFIFPNKELVDLNLLTPMVKSWIEKKNKKTRADTSKLCEKE